MNRILLTAFAALSFAALSSCGPAEESSSLADSPSFDTESAVAIINSTMTDSERGTLGSASITPLYDKEPTLKTMSASCESFNPRSSCNGANQITVDWQDCFFPVGNARLQGGWVSTYNNTSACSQAQSGGLLDGQSVVRTSNGMSISGYYGASLSWNTLAHAAYDTTTIPATGISVSNSGGIRTLTINGAHRTLSTSGGARLFDLSITTPSNLLITGSRFNGSRTILNTGSIRIYNNLESYQATTSFNNVRWTSSSCCYPTAGTATTNFSGSKSGISVLTFNSTCGSASYTDTDNKTKSITLVQCE